MLVRTTQLWFRCAQRYSHETELDANGSTDWKIIGTEANKQISDHDKYLASIWRKSRNQFQHYKKGDKLCSGWWRLN
jgi:hypothetical protein